MLIWLSSADCMGREVAAKLTEHSSKHGAVAQLGERLICIQEVAGSIPTSSTSFSKPSLSENTGSLRPERTGL